MNKSIHEIYKECSDIGFDQRSDAEKAVVWQYNEIKWLNEQIEALQKTNLVDVSPTIQVRRFSGEGSGLSLDSDMQLYYGWDIDADKVMDSLDAVKSMIKVSQSGDAINCYDEIHYQLVINFHSVTEMGG